MKKNSRFLSLILCVVLVAAMALTTVGCGKKDNATADGTAAIINYLNGGMFIE